MFRKLSILFGILVLVSFTCAVPVSEDSKEETTESVEDFGSYEGTDDSNEKRSTEIDAQTTDVRNVTYNGQNLIVIKTVVYEIGILSDATNDTDNSNETHEEIDLTFFDPTHNGSIVDLSNIPFPIQTNVSGVEVTGVLPANFGSIVFGDDGTPKLNSSLFPLLPRRQVTVTHNVSTVDKSKEQLLLDNLGGILGLNDSKPKTDDSTPKTGDETKKNS